jgi:putative hemolysin
MKIDAHETVHFSYAAPDDPHLKKLLIRTIERMTGQPYLKHLYETNRKTPLAGENFWDACVRHLELKIVYNEEALFAVPRHGPLVIVANHPFGVLDGIVISYITSKVRHDFRILTNSVLYRAEELRPYLLPIDFAETKEALAANIKSRAEGRRFLKDGGCVIVFPAGAAATTPKPWSRKAVDFEWGPFTASLIAQSKSSVLPVYFAGQNSRLFQLASHISMTLRLSLFFKEVYDNIGGEIRLRVGKVIPFSQLEAFDRKEFMSYLRSVTYAMAPLTPDPPKSRKPRHQKRVRKTP